MFKTRSQEETQLFKKQLKDLDEASKRDFLIESDIKRLISNLELENCVITNRPTELFVQKHFNHKNNQTSNVQNLSSLLVHPTLRKAYSGNLYNSANANSTATNTAESANKVPSVDLLNDKTNSILDEQNKYKENLIEKFHEKLCNLDRSKSQTKSIIDNLKTNLNEIEAMTANSIFKLTGTKNS